MNSALVAAVAALFLAGIAAGQDQKTIPYLNEGGDAYEAGQFDKAEQAFNKAIEVEPGFSYSWALRGMCRAKLGRYPAALEDNARALELERASPSPKAERIADWISARSMILSTIDRWQEALQAAEEALKFDESNYGNVVLKADALAQLGDVDGAIAIQKPLLATVPLALFGYCDTLRRKGDVEGMLAAIDGPRLHSDETEPVALMWRVEAEADLGKFDEALKHQKEFQDRFTATFPDLCTLSAMYLKTTPGYPGYSLDDTLKVLETNEERVAISTLFNIHARALFLAGRFRECYDLSVTRAVRTNFESLFWLGAAAFKLERFPEARVALTDARRLNPYLRAWAARVPGLGEFVAPIDDEIQMEGKGSATDRKSRFELATHLLSVAEIETLVRGYRFARASLEFERLLPTLTSPVRKREVETRLGEVKGMASALGKLVKAVNGKKAILKLKVAGQELEMTKADDTVFDFSFKKGSGKFPWAYVEPIDFFRFANPEATTPEERYSLGVLLWDVGQDADAQKLLVDVSTKDESLKGRVDALVARKRGIASPKSGFVVYQGRFVTLDEKTNLEKGLVRYQGQWVTPADREQLAKGLVKVGDKWLPGEEKKLLDLGYRKYKGKWIGADDYSALRSQWEEGFEVETAHYKVRTNISESFSQDLAALIETAYPEFRKFYGDREPKLPKGERMTLFAFRDFEDYRKYCAGRKAEQHLNAAGFATSDSNIVVGWNKTGNLNQMLQTMVHEAAHLFYFRVSAPAALPSWHAEGMATYFEGFKPLGALWRFSFVSETRLAYVKEAIRDGRMIPVEELLGANALQLINSDASKALTFYAECWALNYYLCQTDVKLYRGGYAEFRQAVELGKNQPLSKFIPDLKALERDWLKFLASQ